ncbi:MAG: hypothetical protein KDA84_01960 [Planctomycetaceae bacterium]|nr:hypothetical protein [Planctomycetaceae bacterium]
MLQKILGRGSARSIRWCMSLGFGLSFLAMQSLSAAYPEKSAKSNKPRLEEKLKTLSKGSSSEETQRRALAELPLDKLSPVHRTQAQEVLNHLSLFRELPTLAVETTPEVHQFFLDHPEMAVAIWRAMKISKFHLKAEQPGIYNATDNEGTEGRVEVLYRDRHQMLVWCDGVAESPLLPMAIKAHSLLHLQMDFIKTKDDVIWSRNRLRMFVAFPSDAIETAAKVVSPLGNLIIDRNLREVCMFVAMMSTAMVHQPGWVEHIARNVDEVSKERKAELIQLTAEVFVTARKRALEKQNPDEKVTLEDIIRPLQDQKETNAVSKTTK